MPNAPTLQPWRIVAAEIVAAMKADPDALRSIYEDREFRPGRNASVWAQLTARLAQARKAYNEAVAGGYLKEVQHSMLRRSFAHDYGKPGAYMITMAVPERGTNPFGKVRGDMRQGSAKDKGTPATTAEARLARKGITVRPDEAPRYAALAAGEGPLRLELTPLGAAVLQALEGIPANYPMVEVRQAQLMPDHLHVILVVHAPIVSSKGTVRHLGHVVAGYKTGCNKARRVLAQEVEQHNCSTLTQAGGTVGAAPGAAGGAPGAAAAGMAPSGVGTAVAAQAGMAPSGAGAAAVAQAGMAPSGAGAAAAAQAGMAPSGAGAAATGRAEGLCPSAYDGSATTPDPHFKPLWAEGYTDTIILGSDHMATEMAYLDDNIFRLRMKQVHRDLFRTVHHIRINGQEFAALGNMNLLRRARIVQVQFHHWEGDVPAGYRPCDGGWGCRRFYCPSAQLTDTDMATSTAGQGTMGAAAATSTAGQGTMGAAAATSTAGQGTMGAAATSAAGQGTMGAAAPGIAGIYTLGTPIVGPTEAEAHTMRLLEAGDAGAVFVSPFISETEKALRDAALTLGIPYIRLTREGFRDLYTPMRSEFEACCEGNLLLLAPWEDRRRTTTITRRECMALNTLAATIAQGGLALTLVQTPTDGPTDGPTNGPTNGTTNGPTDDNDKMNETINPRDDE